MYNQTKWHENFLCNVNINLDRIAIIIITGEF